MIAVAVIAVSLCRFFMKRYVIRPKKTTAIVVWPDGNEYDVSWIRAVGGRALWTISFESFISIPVIVIVVARRIAFVFAFFM